MSEQERLEAIERLKNDEDYYGEYGKNFISNSDIKTLLNNPHEFHKETGTSKELLMGSYVHQVILEPERPLDGLPIAVGDISSRNSKAYKEQVAESGHPMLLLPSEIADITPVLEKVKRNELFMELLTGNLVEGEIEQPEVKQLFGKWFKGKADRVNRTCNVVIDLKTTSDINKFRGSFFQYGYDTQAYIYNQLFGLEVIFLVVDKKSGALGHYSVSEFTLQNAEEKVKRALDIHELYYGDGGGDIDQFIDVQTI